jgi:hypothetical protein
MGHHGCRKSTLAGGAAADSFKPLAAKAFSIRQSFSIAREGTRLQILSNSWRFSVVAVMDARR